MAEGWSLRALLPHCRLPGQTPAFHCAWHPPARLLGVTVWPGGRGKHREWERKKGGGDEVQAGKEVIEAFCAIKCWKASENADTP